MKENNKYNEVKLYLNLKRLDQGRFLDKYHNKNYMNDMMKSQI